MRSTRALAQIALGMLAIYGSSTIPAAAQDGLDRTVLPIQEPKALLYTELDARNATPPARFQVKAPDGAPNVLIVLIDDMGFGQSSAFGGPIHMPTIEALASEGLRFNQFHTTALCSPTRTALLSGRNHHMNNMGGITEIATAFPGNTGQMPNSVAPVAEMLRLNGYSTAMFGKNHNTAAWEVSVSGPTDRWPTRQGFDKFYGFMGGEANQWAPLLYDGTTQVELPHDPKYHFMTDMTDQAIKWVKAQKALTPDRPFFMYFAPGATHAPHQVPKEWIEKYRGKFDQGWDKVREETLARQKALGVVPADTPLAPKPAYIKDWDTLSADQKRLFARQMEVFAGFGEYADTEIGRLVAAVRDLGQLDNTLVLYIVGDNGASAEGGANGLFNENTYFNGVEETLQDTLKHLNELGGPLAYNHYAAGWAVAGDTPFTWTKQVASSYGGTRNPFVMYILAEAHQGPRRGPLAVAPRDRRRPDHPGGRGAPGAEDRQRHAAGADPRRQHALYRRGSEGGGPTSDAVFRDHRQPRDLPRRLACRYRPPRALGAEAQPYAAERCLGALQHTRRFQPRQQSCCKGVRQAEGDAGPVHAGGIGQPRPAHR
jgi:arylsulfatase A-like enzyme